MSKKLTGNEIRQTFIDFFVEHGHTAVPSMSLVPGGDATLLFTNSGMVHRRRRCHLRDRAALDTGNTARCSAPGRGSAVEVE